MNAISEINGDENEVPVLDVIDIPWGFRIRPADMEAKTTDALIEWTLTFVGVAFLLAAFGQWVLPGSLYVGDAILVKFVLTCILGLMGGVTLSISARGFRPEVQIDRVRHEIRFVSRNPRGRGQVLATVDIDQIIGVGITKSLTGTDCHCLIYLINGEKPLRIATGIEDEVRVIREKMDNYVKPASERLAAKMARRNAA